jgi:hypothetical protein
LKNYDTDTQVGKWSPVGCNTAEKYPQAGSLDVLSLFSTSSPLHEPQDTKGEIVPSYQEAEQ